MLFTLAAAARGTLELEMNLRDYELKSDFFREKIARAEAQAAATAAAKARADADARAILAVLAARGIAVPEAVRAIIVATTDTERLERWIRCAVIAATAEDVVGDD